MTTRPPGTPRSRPEPTPRGFDWAVGILTLEGVLTGAFAVFALVMSVIDASVGDVGLAVLVSLVATAVLTTARMLSVRADRRWWVISLLVLAAMGSYRVWSSALDDAHLRPQKASFEIAGIACLLWPSTRRYVAASRTTRETLGKDREQPDPEQAR